MSKDFTLQQMMEQNSNAIEMEDLVIWMGEMYIKYRQNLKNLMERNAEVMSLKGELSTSKSIQERKKRTLDEQGKRIQAMANDIRGKDEEIRRGVESSNSLINNIDVLNGSLAEANARIEELVADMDERDREIRNLKATVRRRDNKIEELQNE